MIINQSSNVSAVYSQLVQQQSTSRQDEKQEVVATDTVAISEAGKQAHQNWQNIASKYDVNNISAQEARAMSKELFEGGLISTGQMMAIGAPTSMVENPSQKYNLLNDMKHTFSLSNSLSAQTKEARANYLNSISILERLNSEKKGLNG
ncbi:hypothetical protein [Pseudoalteromonas piscicida]|uniref:hypothetical protein n=1 Tax=Pseudoalteromonas piscicida TaxID=43662 RepID=UPI0005F9FAA3|nr:hypothetical protein [Pseudoalteromonas piscicida]KJY92172.1 hypothetical protein TW73_20580 [Pseudoalteromonas piscicida]